MIFFDTSAAYAVADGADPRHQRARSLYESLPPSEGLLIHSYVLIESFALLQKRLGLDTALRFAKDVSGFDVVWVDRSLHEEAVRRLTRKGTRRVSLVDQVSFLVMRERGVDVAFAFDPDFEREGFRVLG